jgi:hypothetical protein
LLQTQKCRKIYPSIARNYECKKSINIIVKLSKDHKDGKCGKFGKTSSLGKLSLLWDGCETLKPIPTLNPKVVITSRTPTNVSNKKNVSIN